MRYRGGKPPKRVWLISDQRRTHGRSQQRSRLFHCPWWPTSLMQSESFEMFDLGLLAAISTTLELIVVVRVRPSFPLDFSSCSSCADATRFSSVQCFSLPVSHPVGQVPLQCQVQRKPHHIRLFCCPLFLLPHGSMLSFVASLAHLLGWSVSRLILSLLWALGQAMPILMAMEALTIQTLSLLFLNRKKGSSFMFSSSVDWRDTTMQRRCLMLLVSTKSLPSAEHSNPSGLSSRCFGEWPPVPRRSLGPHRRTPSATC